MLFFSDSSTISGPVFIAPVGNQTAAIGREVVFSCSVRNIGKYKVIEMRNVCTRLFRIMILQLFYRRTVMDIRERKRVLITMIFDYKQKLIFVPFFLRLLFPFNIF